jgi:hypothetical protein
VTNITENSHNNKFVKIIYIRGGGAKYFGINFFIELKEILFLE